MILIFIIQGWVQEKKEKKTWSEDISHYCLRKCNISNPENAISGSFKALKKNRIKVKTKGRPSLITGLF